MPFLGVTMCHLYWWQKKAPKLFFEKTIKKLCSQIFSQKTRFRALCSGTNFGYFVIPRLLWTFQKWTKINVHFWKMFSTLEKIYDFSTFYIINWKEDLKKRRGFCQALFKYIFGEKGLKETLGVSPSLSLLFPVLFDLDKNWIKHIHIIDT